MRVTRGPTAGEANRLQRPGVQFPVAPSYMRPIDDDELPSDVTDMDIREEGSSVSQSPPRTPRRVRTTVPPPSGEFSPMPASPSRPNLKSVRILRSYPLGGQDPVFMEEQSAQEEEEELSQDEENAYDAYVGFDGPIEKVRFASPRTPQDARMAPTTPATTVMDSVERTRRFLAPFSSPRSRLSSAGPRRVPLSTFPRSPLDADMRTEGDDQVEEGGDDGVGPSPARLTPLARPRRVALRTPKPRSRTPKRAPRTAPAPTRRQAKDQRAAMDRLTTPAARPASAKARRTRATAPARSKRAGSGSARRRLQPRRLAVEGEEDGVLEAQRRRNDATVREILETAAAWEEEHDSFPMSALDALPRPQFDEGTQGTEEAVPSKAPTTTRRRTRRRSGSTTARPHSRKSSSRTLRSRSRPQSSARVAQARDDERAEPVLAGTATRISAFPADQRDGRRREDFVRLTTRARMLQMRARAEAFSLQRRHPFLGTRRTPTAYIPFA